jgi:Sucrase/ferredoxin-like
MEAVDANNSKVNDGRLMLSASNIPVPDTPEVADSTSCILLPAFTIIENVTPQNTPDLITHIINNAPTNTSSLDGSSPSDPTTSLPADLQLKTRPCPHKYLILLCSQKTRDARCGQSAPLLRREFERHLRPLGLYRDLHDERPGGVGIYFISHVGGHKYSANLLIYRRAGSPGAGPTKKTPATPPAEIDREADANRHIDKKEENKEAAQCIWLARVRPEDCENIVRYTILQGKVVKPDRQLRGGFDRGKQLISW